MKCLFSVTIGCGQTSSENCTYFDSSSPTAGACSVTICPCSNDICQVRNIKIFITKLNTIFLTFSAPAGLPDILHHRPCCCYYHPGDYPERRPGHAAHLAGGVRHLEDAVPDRHLLRHKPWRELPADHLRAKHGGAQ